MFPLLPLNHLLFPKKDLSSLACSNLKENFSEKLFYQNCKLLCSKLICKKCSIMAKLIANYLCEIETKLIQKKIFKGIASRDWGDLQMVSLDRVKIKTISGSHLFFLFIKFPL
jgi:hypothetical protein